ncbi:MAG: HIT domain-containing protein [Patescibacteria group bacterium]
MCIFCKIINNEIPADKIYEDDKIVAFLDINPVSPGHTLVIPKEHYQMMVDTPDELVSYIFVQCKKLMQDLKKAMGADFVVLSVVGIDVPHFHIHLIPRKYDDGLANFWPTEKYGEGGAGEIAEKIRNNISF